MLWNWYTIDACFLTSSWHITNNAMFAVTCIGVVLLVTFVEFTRRLGKEYDAFLLRQFQREATRRTYRDGTPRSNSEHSPATFPCSSSSSSQVIKFRASLLQQLMRAVLHALTFGTAYVVMLLAMYFNGYVIICIFIGAGVGKFFCDWLEVRIGGGEGYGGQGKVADGMGGVVQDPSACC